VGCISLELPEKILGLTQSNLRKANGREFEGFALNWGNAPNPLKFGFYLSRCVSPEYMEIKSKISLLWIVALQI
jgi:hypothetical protein